MKKLWIKKSVIICALVSLAWSSSAGPPYAGFDLTIGIKNDCDKKIKVWHDDRMEDIKYVENGDFLVYLSPGLSHEIRLNEGKNTAFGYYYFYTAVCGEEEKRNVVCVTWSARKGDSLTAVHRDLDAAEKECFYFTYRIKRATYYEAGNSSAAGASIGCIESNPGLHVRVSAISVRPEGVPWLHVLAKVKVTVNIFRP